MTSDIVLPPINEDLSIGRIDAFPLIYPTKGRFKFFEGPKGRPDGRAAVLIKITASNGIIGWGQSVPVPRWSYETLETTYSTTTRSLAPELIGQNPFDDAAINEIFQRTIAPSFSTGQPICKAGLDLALWDLKGKLLNLPLAEQWQRKPLERVGLSWTLNPRRIEDVEQLVQEGLSCGYQHFNVKIAPDLKFDLELCAM